MPGASQPYVSDVDALARTDDIILEYIAPFGVGSMARCYDVATGGTVDLQGVTVEIDITIVVDEVNGTLDERVLDVVASRRTAGGNPGVLIGEQRHIVHADTVGNRVQRQSLRTVQLLVAVAVLKGDILKEGVCALYHHGSTWVNGVGVVTTAETIVVDNGLVAVLTDNVQMGLGSRDVDVLMVTSILDEDEPRLCASSRCMVYGILQFRVVTGAILSHYGIIQLCLGLLTLHGGKGDGGGGYSLSATAYKHALRHREGVLSSIFQTCILEDSRLAADDRCYLLTIQRSRTRTSLDLVVEVEYHRAIARCSCSVVSWRG